MQGFNMGRYYPPSTDSPPHFNTSANLSKTQRKTPAGSQIVRFEMPFHVWCRTCPRETIIPQGVRFNAEKKKIGLYLSTPIWSFRMKHTVCGGRVEIRTSPKDGEYLVAEGGRRRDYGTERGGDDEGEGKFLTEHERERRRNDAFAALEGKREEETQGKERGERIDEIYDATQKNWSDPYEVNRKVRKDFRKDRKARARQEEQRIGIRDKFCFAEDFEIMDENDRDRVHAKMIEFGSGIAEDVATKPLFSAVAPFQEDKNDRSLSKAEREAVKKKANLQQQLRGNTRATMDPFRVEKKRAVPKLSLGIKKSSSASLIRTGSATSQLSPKDSLNDTTLASTLVGYNSN